MAVMAPTLKKRKAEKAPFSIRYLLVFINIRTSQSCNYVGFCSFLLLPLIFLGDIGVDKLETFAVHADGDEHADDSGSKCPFQKLAFIVVGVIVEAVSLDGTVDALQGQKGQDAVFNIKVSFGD